MTRVIFAVPQATHPSTCRRCGARIFWITSDVGRRVPVNCAAEFGGHEPTTHEHGQGVSHHTVCGQGRTMNSGGDLRRTSRTAAPHPLPSGTVLLTRNPGRGTPQSWMTFGVRWPGGEVRKVSRAYLATLRAEGWEGLDQIPGECIEA